jgi:hypothetical protein
MSRKRQKTKKKTNNARAAGTGLTCDVCECDCTRLSFHLVVGASSVGMEGPARFGQDLCPTCFGVKKGWQCQARGLDTEGN